MDKERLASMDLTTDAQILAAADRIAASSPFAANPYGTSGGAAIVAAAEEIRAKSDPKDAGK